MRSGGGRATPLILLAELASGLWLTLRYMFKPAVTVNYPYEKGPLSIAEAASL